MTQHRQTDQNSQDGPDRNLALRIMDVIAGARESMGQDVQHNVDRLLSFFQDPHESVLSTGRKFRNSEFVKSILSEIEEHPTKTALSLTDTGAVARGLIEGDPLEFGAGAVGMALGPFASAGGIKAALKRMQGMRRNRQLAERMGGNVNVPAGGLGIPAPPGSEIVQAQRARQAGEGFNTGR